MCACVYVCQSRPSAISAMPATQSEGGCHQVPRLLRKMTIDVAKCHACHAKRVAAPSVTPKTKHATKASPMPYAPRLPHKVAVDVTKYHACHAK